VVGDVRHDDDVARAVQAAVDRFGGIEIVVNNASVLDLRRFADLRECGRLRL
jgi:citronellol/citronellal dehydrogenase